MKNPWLILFFLPLFALSQTDFERAEKLFAQQKFSESQPLFETDLKQNPKHLQSMEYLGDIQSFSKNWDTAVGYYEKLKTANPNEADYQYKYGGALAMLAQQSSKFKALGMIDDIEASLLKAIKLNPKYIDARWALIEFYLQLPGIFGGSESKADRYANELGKISAVDGYLSKARIAEYFERFTTAEKYYKLAIEVGNSKTTYQKLADLYKNKLNEPAKAKEVLENYAKTKG
ncbi:MAG TPA: hypothetical protein VK528_13600 [Flavobacterium sp.]|nr:hypothetical protein [Flavobacterium sp.]